MISVVLEEKLHVVARTEDTEATSAAAAAVVIPPTEHFSKI